MGLNDEYLKLRKKRLEEEEKEEPQKQLAPLFVNKTAALYKVSQQGDIAPFRSTGKKAEEKEKERKWFEKGAFEDGYQFGDVTKTILGTLTDTAENLGAGIIGMGEKAADAVTQLGAWSYGGLTQTPGVYPVPVYSFDMKEREKAMDDAAEFIAKDLYDEEKVAKKIISAPVKSLTGIDAETESVFGEKTDSLAQSGGQLLATAGLQAVGVPWFVTTGVTAYGGELENAYKEGATFEEAGTSALISAGAEILTEKLSGGIKFGGKALDDVLVKQLSRSISNKAVRTMAKVGLDAVGEGSEEVISQVFSNLGSALYKEESVGELLTNEQAMDEYLESFIGGAVLGGVSGGINTAKSAKNGVDYASGLTKNEQAVVDKLYKDRVAEEEKSGKVSEKQKSKIYDEVLEDMDKGYISTDTIEEVLGGDTYKTHKDTLAQEEALQQEYDTLYKMKNMEKSDEQIDRQAELKKQLDDIKQNFNRNQLGEEVFSLVQNDRLAESYNERGRRKQAFTVDLTQYDSKYHDTLKRAAESGILNDTRRTHEFVDLIAKISADKGVLFDFTNNEKLKNSGFAVDGKQVNGFVTKDGVTLNIDSAKSLNSVVGHEITHVLEGTEFYDALQKAVIEYASKKSDYRGRVKALSEIYKDVEGADISKELTAELVGDYLFGDTDFINSLSTGNRNVFQKIYDEIKYLCKVATAGSKEARELERVKRAFENAYRESGKVSNDTKYSVSPETDKSYMDAANRGDTETAQKMVDEAAKAAGYTIKSYHGTLDKNFTEFSKDFIGSRFSYDEQGFFFIDRRSLAEDYATSEFNANRKGRVIEAYLKAKKPMVVDAKFLIKEGMGNLYRNDDPIGVWDSYQPYFIEEAENRGADAIILDDGETKMTVVFDPNQIKSAEAITYDNSGNVIPLSARFNTKSNDIRYSLSDSDGKQLTKEQQEYFKDSKIRDENGSLKVMYHGTPNGDFTVFRDGTYFTDSKEYADRYQSPSASSISTGKVASNPKTFEVYLDIKKPFDLSDAEARDIYINDYIKGGNALGINPYLSDAEYAKINAIDWTEGEDLRDFLIENGYDYDGLVLDEGGAGGYGEEVEYRGKSYVIFSPEQVKNADNLKPTADKDIRFSLSKPVEETKDLMALHNLHTSEVLKQLEMGGLPYPSIAVTNPAKIAHEDFGEISLILNKDAIDPEKNKYNHIYSSDAYTPTFPHVYYEANTEVAENVSDRIKAQFDKLPDYHQRSIRSLRDYTNLNDVLNRFGGMQGVINGFADDHGMKQVYLAEKGENVPLEIKRTETQLSAYKKEQYQKVVDKIGADELASLNDKGNYNTLGDARIAWAKEHLDVLKDIYAEDWASDGHFSKEEALEMANEQKLIFWYKEAVGALRYMENGGITVEEKEDYDATNAKIDEKIKNSDYMQWLSELFSGIEGQSGIRNNKDTFLPSGKRRNFAQLHDPVTIDNVIKVMRKKDQTGLGALGGNFNGAAVQEYGSIAETKRNANMLGVIDDAEYSAIKKRIDDKLFDISNRYANGKDIIDARNTIVEAVSKKQTKAGIAKYLQQYDYVYKYTDDIGDDIIALRDYVRSLPRPYFEAKPRRAVSFDEVGVFVIPNNADAKLKQELLNRGYAIAEYNPDVEGDRQKVVNQFEEYKFSLSREGEQFAPTRRNEVYGRDIRLEQEVAPVTVAENATVDAPNVTEAELFPDNYAPTAEEEEAYQSGRIASLDDADAPPEMEAPYYEGNPVTADDPFENRAIEDVGNRKTKAYMYENPEVKPFFQAEAKVMLGELGDSMKGERWYNDELYYETNGEHGWGGTRRYTSDEIAYLLDEWHYTYKQIQDGLNAIIEDNGKENNAVSKRIEFILNDRLKNGYTDFRDGLEIPPDQDYINLLNEKQINEYSEEAFEAFMQTADLQFFSRENEDDIAPEVETNIGKMPVADYRDMVARQNGFDDYEDMRRQGVRLGDSYDTDIAPVPASMAVKDSNPTLTEKYEAIKPKKQKELKMAKATPQEQLRAQILTEEPVTPKKKGGAWAMFKDNFVDKGTAFETLDLKRGSRELQARFKSIGRAESSAQWFMEHGKAEASSLKSIRDTVESSGKTKDFYEYLYHQHNVDRMSLEERFEDVENKPVIGYDVTAEMSRAEVAKLEQANPEFKEWAQEVYGYMNYLRQMLVDGGVISADTAKLWAKMYPHYVPIRRKGDEGLNINVALDTRRTGVNAPIKKATGGNRDILPLFDTMAMRTEQTFKAVARNRFGVELKNALGIKADGEGVDIDEAIDSVDTHEELLQEGKNGRNPTFTVFDNGKKVTFDITDEMYDTMKPKSKLAGYTNKVLNKANNIRRGLITEYNPAFMFTNPIKDIQDVLINSQHPARTYANIPKAISELWNKNGHWYQEYMENGGEQNTYFDDDTKTFAKEKSGLSKVIGFPLEKISAANNFIERIPRMAEYIASRQEGRSIDVAMLDAARVTTDFSAGGDVVKALNRNGFTFLNASVQGAVQQVRNVREAKAEGLKGWAKLAAKVTAAGLPAMLLNHLLWDDDEDYAELSDYVKQNYYIVGKYGDGQFVRIPKGRALAVIQDAFKQMENLVTGNDEADLRAFGELMVSNLAPTNPLENNLIAPITQAIKNKAWYGDDLVPSRLQSLPAAEQYDESTDVISRWLGEKLNISPYKINYVLDQYSGGVGDMFLPMLTPEAEKGNKNALGNLIAPLRDKFTTDSVMNNQNVSDFYDTKDKLTVNANAYDATDEDKLMSKYMNSITSELGKLYGEKREIQNSSLSDAEKYEAVREIQKQIIALTKESLNTYEDIRYEDDHAIIGDRYYKKNDEGEWQKLTDDQVTKYEVTSEAGDAPYASDGDHHYRWYEPGEDSESEAGWRKITDEQLEKQEEVTSALGISPEEYWGNKEEYDYAYKNPESYAVAKAVGGYDAYKVYSSELYDIKADKDANGKSITGSRKEKVQEYINNMDADYYTKIILWKSEYTSDDSYNMEIIDYLNGREDISYEEEIAILRKLGFEVDSKGNISW